MTSLKKVSLSEVNQSIDTPNNNRFGQNLKAFLGPGALVAVGYMDPGNWITSVVGGATYKSIWVTIPNFLFDCHAVATNVWEIRDCNPDGLGASYCLSLAKMVAIHALGYLGVSLDGDGLG